MKTQNENVQKDEFENCEWECARVCNENENEN